MKSELCRTCVHTKVCMKNKNIVGDFYVAPHPFFFDEEYKKKSWEEYKLREKQGFPCDDYKAEKHGQWIKMSDVDGIYYVCSECANELPRVINSFDPQLDLFPKLKCVDKTTYCPHCGAKMNEKEKNNG